MIVLAFWGLTRSTQYTAASIEKRVFSQLPAPFVVFVHTYSSENVYENVRANEKCSSLKPDVAGLRPYRVEVDDLDAVKSKLSLEQYRTQPDPWGTNYQTVDNFVLAMYSKQRVTEMVAESGLTPAKVIFLRPDVRYLSNIGKALAFARPDAWVVPDFHLIRGFNDRFCVASPANYRVYGCVFHHLLPYSRRKPLHSESFYADLAAAAGVKVVRAPFYFQRVRLTGETDPRDGSLLDETVHQVRHKRADAGHVHFDHGVVRDGARAAPICETFALRPAHGITFVRKPAGVVLFNVGV
jgi:hypothetical protein